jgi:hypothetical protein
MTSPNGQTDIIFQPATPGVVVDFTPGTETNVGVTSGSVPGPQGIQGPKGDKGDGIVVIEATDTAPPAGTAPNTVVFRKIPN